MPREWTPEEAALLEHLEGPAPQLGLRLSGKLRYEPGPNARQSTNIEDRRNDIIGQIMSRFGPEPYAPYQYKPSGNQPVPELEGTGVYPFDLYRSSSHPKTEY